MKVNRDFVSENNTYEGNAPRYIVVHNTDNFASGADASAHARAQHNGNLSTSVHYYTDVRVWCTRRRPMDGAAGMWG